MSPSRTSRGTPRSCPNCGRDKLCSGREALAIYRRASWADEETLDPVSLMCPFCTWARYHDGSQTTLTTPGDRAYELAQATSQSDKDRDYWRAQIDPAAGGGSGR